ncbi:MAG: cell division protein FtsQ/DivIB [Roseobacter sp.]|jgi:cell division protein FtsQ
MRSLIRKDPKSRVSDPAPSRWAWRIERLMLTPAFLLFLRIGIPFSLAFAASSWWLSDVERRSVITETFAEARAHFQTRPEFMVHLMAIDGAQAELAENIRAEVPLNFPLSSFDLDLGQVRDKVVALDPVKSATVRIRPGGVLQIDVEPRIPVVIWRHRKGLALVDADGAHVARLNHRMDRPDLPLIAGEGAADHVAEALALYRALTPLGARLRGLVRMGERRWDIVLDRNQRILLPEKNAVQALERIIALDGAQDILGRDVKRVDLRLGTRPTVQMSEFATEMWWDVRQASGQ